MQKIIFTDKNKKLCKAVEKVFAETINNTHCELIVRNDDVLKVKKEFPEAKIITASNPDFDMAGGLDAVLKKAYPEQCNTPREFKFEKDLFFVVSVDRERKATDYWIKRAFFGAYMCSRKNDIIITGIGIGIGELNEDDFIKYITNFVNANFRYSDFRYSNFRSSDFSSSDFSSSDFSSSNFRSSNFRSSDFSSSDFSSSDFSSSNFRSSDFSSSDFRYSNFSNVKFNYKITPQEGKFIGWKKANGKIIKLEIQNADKVSGGFVGRKLRTNKVKVLEIQEKDGTKAKDKEIASGQDKNFIYKLGKIIEEPKYVHDDKIECSQGIHFFITRQEAVEY